MRCYFNKYNTPVQVVNRIVMKLKPSRVLMCSQYEKTKPQLEDKIFQPFINGVVKHLYLPTHNDLVNIYIICGSMSRKIYFS